MSFVLPSSNSQSIQNEWHTVTGAIISFLQQDTKRVSNVISENLHYACPTSITKEDNHLRQSEEFNCILHF